MNKVFNINLGGYPFTIDDDAYDYLKNYLKTIHRHFRDSEGYEEITADIESRLAELFRDDLGTRPIVTLAVVKDAVTIMGTPEDFGAEPLTDDPAEEETYEKKKRRRTDRTDYRTGKRLFRNPEDEVVGGVCSGIAAYFGIEDPLWVRLGFALFFFAGGFALPLYFILWVIMPEAKTSADFLAMRGEPITASNIAKVVEEKVTEVTESIAEFGEEMNEKFGSGRTAKKKSFSGEFGGKSGLSGFILGMGTLLKNVLLFLTKIIRPLLFVFGVLIVLTFVLVWVAFIIGLLFGQPYVSLFFPEQMNLANLGIVSLFLMVGLPLVSVVFYVARLLLGTRVPPKVVTGLIVLNVFAWVGFFAAASVLSGEFRASAETVIDTVVSEADVLHLQTHRNYERQKDNLLHIDRGEEFAPFSEFFLQNQQMITDNTEVTFVRGDDPDITVRQSITSRGKSRKEALVLAEKTAAPQPFTDDTLTVATHTALPQDVKFRGQRIRIVVAVPPGKSVTLGKYAGDVITRFPREADETLSPYHNPCALWTMGENGFYCAGTNTE